MERDHSRPRGHDTQHPSRDTRPRLDYYRHLRSLVDKYDLGRLKSGDKKSSSGFCLHNGRDLSVYYVPKENLRIDSGMPRNLAGRSMNVTWFDPFSGVFGEPAQKQITQRVAFRKPTVDRFASLIVRIEP